VHSLVELEPLSLTSRFTPLPKGLGVGRAVLRLGGAHPSLISHRASVVRHHSSHLNSGLIVSGFISSTILSSVGIQLGARWQFCSTTQQPDDCASVIRAAALGPWPWPREMAVNRLDMPFSAADTHDAEAGSTQQYFGFAENNTGAVQDPPLAKSVPLRHITQISSYVAESTGEFGSLSGSELQCTVPPPVAVRQVQMQGRSVRCTSPTCKLQQG